MSVEEDREGNDEGCVWQKFGRGQPIGTSEVVAGGLHGLLDPGPDTSKLGSVESQDVLLSCLADEKKAGDLQDR